MIMGIDQDILPLKSIHEGLLQTGTLPVVLWNIQ
jgi:hypothetical protein